MRHSVSFHPGFVAILLLALVIGCGGNSSGSSAGATGGTAPPVPVTKEWTWVGGSNVGAASGVYGTEGIAAADNAPGSRAEAASWTDTGGNLWLFGGGPFDPLGTKGPLNDLWEYNPTAKEWTWVSGSSTVPGNQIGIYGTLGAPAPTNVPGGRSGFMGV